MLRHLLIAALITVCPGNVWAQSDPAASAFPDDAPEAVAITCFRLQGQTVSGTGGGRDVPADAPNVLMYAVNSCNYPINVVARGVKNIRASLMCKTEGADISTLSWKIRANAKIETDLQDGVNLRPMARKAPAKPVLVTVNNGKCVKAD